MRRLLTKIEVGVHHPRFDYLIVIGCVGLVSSNTHSRWSVLWMWVGANAWCNAEARNHAPPNK